MRLALVLRLAIAGRQDRVGLLLEDQRIVLQPAC
jgi:hypothetical protein